MERSGSRWRRAVRAKDVSAMYSGVRRQRISYSFVKPVRRARTPLMPYSSSTGTGPAPAGNWAATPPAAVRTEVPPVAAIAPRRLSVFGFTRAMTCSSPSRLGA
jgi:hypothetical protein